MLYSPYVPGKISIIIGRYLPVFRPRLCTSHAYFAVPILVPILLLLLSG